MVSDQLGEVPGMCGVVDGGILPGLWGYEAGQGAQAVRRPAQVSSRATFYV
jgi:ribulose kinase